MKQNTLMPEYMKNFKCIGGECEDTCCAGWTVSIDRKTYKNYQKVKDPVLRDKLSSGLRRNKNNANRSDRYYASFILTEKNCCSMLTEDKWCAIQMKLGEKALSNTCNTYPRNLNKYDQNYELSGKVSCPEIARLVLLQPQGIEFEEAECELESNWPVVKTGGIQVQNNYTQYFWPIRMLAIEIIQRRTMLLGDRMVLLGLFIDALQNDIERNYGLSISDIIDSFRSKLHSPEYTDSIAELRVNLDLKLQALFELIKSRLDYGISMDRYQVTYKEMMEGLNQDSEVFDLDKFRLNYEENFKVYYSSYMDEKEYILENYLVNNLFGSLFPNLSEKEISLFDEYALLSVIYGMLKIHLVGVSGKHKGLSDEIVIRTIQAYAKTIEHNNSYINSILVELKRNNYDTLAHISLLVKD
ncbi:flagellin lysine-N-methylase [Paenibacillus sp. FJAT-26967]|uniref:flagellin lysine-N-methylase n=1 Tax=Paenibacillus sp. FJAT-26967 TaxID=1729690 RepID=UPI0008388733|nr:flagellin lysine-N-methylase [Paenibacillus sp. FJAT-26967]